MNTTIELLNDVLAHHKGVAIAAKFELSSGVVSQWKKNQHVPPYYAAKLAEVLGEDPERAMAISAAEAERDASKRAYLLTMLRSKLPSAEQQALALLLEENNGGPPVSRTRHQRIMSPLL